MGVPIPTGFKTEDGEWTEETKDRFFGAKNMENLTKWADGQRQQYGDEESEKGKALREKYSSSEDLEVFIKQMFVKKWDTLLNKAAKCPRVFFDMTIGGEKAGRIIMTFGETWCQRQRRTSGLYAQARKALGTRIVLSIE